MDGFQNKVDKTPNQITAEKSSCLNLSMKVVSYILYQWVLKEVHFDYLLYLFRDLNRQYIINVFTKRKGLTFRKVTIVLKDPYFHVTNNVDYSLVRSNGIYFIIYCYSTYVFNLDERYEKSHEYI